MSIFLLVAAAYGFIGIVFACWFVVRGAAVMDAAAQEAPFRVRLIFAPGAVALWPMLLAKLLQNGGAR